MDAKACCREWFSSTTSMSLLTVLGSAGRALADWLTGAEDETGAEVPRTSAREDAPPAVVLQAATVAAASRRATRTR
jgi:hypothetical protein